MPKEPVFEEELYRQDEIIGKDALCRLCRISKRHAEYLLQSGLIPCRRTGRKTRCYRIRTEDVKHYLEQREIDPERYRPPKNWYSRNAREVKLIPGQPLPELPASDIVAYYRNALTAYPDVMDIDQVCDLTGYHRHTVKLWMREGHLKSLLVQNKRRIPKPFLLEFVASDYYSQIPAKSRRHQLAIRVMEKARKAKEPYYVL